MDNRGLYLDKIKSFNKDQRKFDYFFLGISMALLSLSVQSYQISTMARYDLLLIVAWLFLLLSILCGFFRFEKTLLSLSSEVEIIEAVEIGNKSTESDFVRGGHKAIDKYNKHAVILYKIQKWYFIISLLLFITYKSIDIIAKNSI
jgi:hypothetical protein